MPEDLETYAQGAGELNQALRQEAASLGEALAAFRASDSEYVPRGAGAGGRRRPPGSTRTCLIRSCRMTCSGWDAAAGQLAAGGGKLAGEVATTADALDDAAGLGGTVATLTAGAAEMADTATRTTAAVADTTAQTTTEVAETLDETLTRIREALQR